MKTSFAVVGFFLIMVMVISKPSEIVGLNTCIGVMITPREEMTAKDIFLSSFKGNYDSLVNHVRSNPNRCKTLIDVRVQWIDGIQKDYTFEEFKKLIYQ
jgi:hypothetical protein